MQQSSFPSIINESGFSLGVSVRRTRGMRQLKAAGTKMPAASTAQTFTHFKSSGTLPPFSASFVITCLCSQTFIAAESSVLPV